MEGNFVPVSLPVFVFGATPRDIIIPGFLAVLAQGSQTIDHSQIVTVNGDAVLVICVSGHGTFHDCWSQVTDFVT